MHAARLALTYSREAARNMRTNARYSIRAGSHRSAVLLFVRHIERRDINMKKVINVWRIKMTRINEHEKIEKAAN